MSTFFKAYGALEAKKDCVPLRYEPRPLGPNDVEVRITHCGICFSDIHELREGWGKSMFPLVPGHEIIGQVTAMGAEVRQFTVGQRVGVGTYVLSCFECRQCQQHREQMCEKAVWTYNSKYPDGELAFGGYAEAIRAHQRFVFAIPDALSSAGAAPLLCAGLTTYVSLTHHQVKLKRVGVMGLGGLGHLGVRIAKALQNDVTVISHSPNKQPLAEKYGAKFLCTSSEADMKAHRQSFDFLLVTANHDDLQLVPLLELLDAHGTLCIVGLPEVPLMLDIAPLLSRGRSIAGSMTGGTEQVKQMLQFCAQHRIEAEVEVLPISEVNRALQGLREGKPRFRYVLDTSRGLDFDADKAATYERGKGLTQKPSGQTK